MSRRIEIELTSRGADGSWTWRAAGARQPRGSVGPELVPEGARVGEVLRAEVESGIDGVELVSLSPRLAKEGEPDPNRIEVLGAGRSGPDVSVTYAPGGRRRGERDGEERRGQRRPGRGPRPEGEEGRPRGERSGPARRRPSEGAPRTNRADGGPGRAERPGSGRSERPGSGRSERPGPVRRDRRPTVAAAHRNALLATLGPERLPVAEQLLRGGIPAVRQAIDEQNARAKALGGVPVNGGPLLALAEELLPAVNLATWKDRAVAAQAAGKELRLRELRAVVAASRTVNLDEEGRALAKELRESLDRRVTALRDEWVGRITAALDDQRVLDALHLAGRPPEPATRLPAELAVRVAEAAGAALTAEADPSTWREVLEAVVETPVRRTVKPQGIPEDPSAQAAARAVVGSVPALAKLLGIRIPPPPPPAKRPRSPLSGAAGGGRAAAR